MSSAADIWFEGRVQGVGFRYSTVRLAAGYDVTGWVRNEPDGRVQVHAEGRREEVEAFVTGIQESDLGGLIKQTELHWTSTTGGRGFEIR